MAFRIFLGWLVGWLGGNIVIGILVYFLNNGYSEYVFKALMLVNALMLGIAMIAVALVG